MDQEGEDIKIGFHPVAPQLINIISCQVETEPIQPTSPKIERPEFGPRPDTGSTNFNFKCMIDLLPFQMNIGKEANLIWEQQSHFINVIYENKEVFLLHDEDLSYCDQCYLWQMESHCGRCYEHLIVWLADVIAKNVRLNSPIGDDRCYCHCGRWNGHIGWNDFD